MINEGDVSENNKSHSRGRKDSGAEATEIICSDIFII